VAVLWGTNGLLVQELSEPLDVATFCFHNLALVFFPCYIGLLLPKYEEIYHHFHRALELRHICFDGGRDSQLRPI
jgi:hypothetical protein